MKSQQFMAISLSLLATIGLTAPRWKMGIALATAGRLANGQIIQIKGEVQIERSHGSILSPSPGTSLYPGDQLLTTNGAQVLVYCADGTSRLATVTTCYPYSRMTRCTGLDWLPEHIQFRQVYSLPVLGSKIRNSCLTTTCTPCLPRIIGNDGLASKFVFQHHAPKRPVTFQNFQKCRR